VRHARSVGVEELAVEEFQSITGQGVRGRMGGTTLLLGRRELLERGPLAEWAKKLPPASAELSEVWVMARDLVGRILLKDQIRAESTRRAGATEADRHPYGHADGRSASHRRGGRQGTGVG
jgi:Cd2+/Zn2+-exporting ATPase